MTERSLAAVLLVAVCSCTLPCACSNTASTQDIRLIDAADAVALVRNGAVAAGLIIIDVRTPDEYAAGHIPDAINADYRADGWREAIDTLAKDRTYLVYCASGSRSAAAVEVMRELGFTDVLELAGGIEAYKAAGGDVESGVECPVCSSL